MDLVKMAERIAKVNAEHDLKLRAAKTDQDRKALEQEHLFTERRVHFGAQLQDLREKEKQTRLEFVKNIGVSVSYLKQIEYGEIPLHRKKNLVNKLVKNVKGWSRRAAYQTLGIKISEMASPIMTINKAKEEFANALQDSRGVNEFLLRALGIRSLFENDQRGKNPGEFLRSQEVAEILTGMKNFTVFQCAEGLMKIISQNALTQKQWEQLFRPYVNASGKSILAKMLSALATIGIEEAEDVRKFLKQQKKNEQTVEAQLQKIKPGSFEEKSMAITKAEETQRVVPEESAPNQKLSESSFPEFPQDEIQPAVQNQEQSLAEHVKLLDCAIPRTKDLATRKRAIKMRDDIVKTLEILEYFEEPELKRSKRKKR